METASILLMVMFGFSGFMALLLGYQVKRHQSVESISLPNLSVDKIRDKAGFSRFAGNRAMVIGLTSIITAVITGLFSQFLMMAILLFILLVTAMSLEFIIGCKKYFKVND
jgi:hypothetical protein